MYLVKIWKVNLDSLDKQQKYLLKDFAFQNLYLPLDNEKATLFLTSDDLAFLH